MTEIVHDLRTRSARQGSALRALLWLLQHPDRDFVDVPGFLPGTAQEYGAIIKHGSKQLFAFAETTVPKRWRWSRARPVAAPMTSWARSICGATSTSPGPWQRSRWWAPRARSRSSFRSDIGDSDKIEARTEEYRAKFANPFVAGSRGFIDDVIMPHGTRRRLCRSLAMLREKQLSNPWKKHDNIPL
jgi:propionyl-CoA carboxylase beta chain